MPDKLTFFSIYNPFDLCAGTPRFFESDVSQADADLGARRCPFPDGIFFSAATTCQKQCPNGTFMAFTAPSAMFHAVSRSAADALALNYACGVLNLICGVLPFASAVQTCEIDCGNDTTASYTVAAGSFGGTTQALADAAAFAFACEVASLLCFGDPPVLFTSTQQTCVFECPGGGTIRYTAVAGMALGLSQADADASALAFACAMAQVLCDARPDPVGNTPQTCSIVCLGTPASYTVPAGAFIGPDLFSANLAAFTFACQTINKSCADGEIPPAMIVPNTKQTCSFPCAGGGTFTVTVPPGAFRAENLAAANAAAQTYACTVASTHASCLGGITTSVCRGTALAEVIPTTGDAPASWGITGSLPPGLSFSGGLLSGTAAVIGTYAFTVFARNAFGTASRSYTFTVAGITSPSLPSGTAGDAYLATVTVGGYTDPNGPRIRVIGGTLPTGLTMNTDGVISGTPSAAGTYDFVVEADGEGLVCTKPLSIVIVSSLSCPDWTQLLWDVPNIIGTSPPDATGSMSPSGATGAVFTITSAVADIGAGLFLVQGANDAELSYNGAGCNCQLEVNFSGAFTNPMEISGSINILQNGISIFSTPFTLGVTTYPFTLNNTGGAPQTLHIDLSFQCHNLFGGGPCNMNVQGTLSNV